MHPTVTSFKPIWVESRFSQGREFRGFDIRISQIYGIA